MVSGDRIQLHTPDPEVAHLLDEAREALREAERRGG
jgi:hypothetical protein